MPAWKPSYALIWTNAAASRLLLEIAPHLRVKSRQAAALLQFDRHLRHCRRFRDRDGRLLPLSARELTFRQAFYDRLKRLNVRGPRVRPSRIVRDRNQRKPSAEYIAGFLDGEGSFMIPKSESSTHRSPEYRTRISVANTDRTIMEEIQRAYGGLLFRESRARFGWSDLYQLVWTDGMVGQILRSVTPHLRIKREQARALSELIRHRHRTRQGRRGPNGRFSAALPSDVIAFRERLYRRVRKLNARGVPPNRRPLARTKRASTGRRRSPHNRRRRIALGPARSPP